MTEIMRYRICYRFNERPWAYTRGNVPNEVDKSYMAAAVRSFSRRRATSRQRPRGFRGRNERL